MFGIPIGKFTRSRSRAEPYSDDKPKWSLRQSKNAWPNRALASVPPYTRTRKNIGAGCFMDGMTLVIEVLAVISMLLSIVLVLNTLTAVITQQTNQIGILKAIGGSSFTITKVYLAGVLVYGVLSLLVALPLRGVGLVFRSSRSGFWGCITSITISYSLSNRTLMVEVVGCAGGAAAAALVAGLERSRSSPSGRPSASYGLGGDFGTNWIDRFVERIGRRFLVSYNAMALSNTFRRKGRLLLTQLVLVMAGVMFLMVMSLSSSITATNDAEFGRHTYDAIFNLEEMQRLDRTRQLVQSVSGVEKADMWLAIPASILHQGQKKLDAGLGAQLQGIPLDDPMYRPLIAEGRWLEPADDQRRGDEQANRR